MRKTTIPRNGMEGVMQEHGPNPAGLRPSSPRDENPRTTRNVTRTKPLFHEPAPSNSYRRGRCNVGRGVSFGGRTTSFHGVQKGAEGRRSTVAPCRGGSTAPTHTHTYSWLQGTRGRSLHHVEREAHTDAPPRLLNRALSLSLSLSLEVC